MVNLQSDPELGDWVEARYLDQILNTAASELREAISERIEEIGQEEAKAGENDANE